MRTKASICIVSAALCLLTSCAQPGAPLPPSLGLPRPPTDLRAFRKGNTVVLSWSEPLLTTDHQSIRDVGPTLICRSVEKEISACGKPVRTIPGPEEPGFPPVRKLPKPTATPRTATDTLPAALSGQNPSGDITYAVEVLNGNGRSAGLSNSVHVPAAPTLPAPQDLTANLNDDGVLLTWTAVAESHAAPGLEHRYRIYRREEGSTKEGSTRDAIAGELPLAEAGAARYQDSTIVWEKNFAYRITVVTAVTQAAGEVQVEGEDSPAVRIFAHDVFPPAVPAGLQAVYSGEGQKPFIDLIWAPVTNADLAGYNVYRGEGNGSKVKVNSELVKTPAYRDGTVTSGNGYTYSVSAVDLRGNESARSETAEESVP